MAYFLEFLDAADQRLKTPVVEIIESDSPIPVVPVTGDTVMIEQQHFIVVHRHIIYYSTDIHIQCFCRESHEGHIREHCGQSVDLSEPDL